MTKSNKEEEFEVEIESRREIGYNTENVGNVEVGDEVVTTLSKGEVIEVIDHILVMVDWGVEVSTWDVRDLKVVG